jgi:NAD(P)-dependent dehydrogenase (short-subunit alcohol dehydrogenase family)
MNKKIILGGTVAILAGIGAYKFITQQKDGRKEMGDNWTTANMPDLAGKIIIVTGANSGIGFEAAREFARKNAQTILACRNMDKGQAALAEIQAEIPTAQVELLQLDLASQASVHQFAAEFKTKYDQLDLLVNNAGIMMVPYGTTEDDFERQLGTNHLGHFALTGLLIDLLLKTPGSRVVNISSNAHRRTTGIDFDNLMYEGGKDYSSQEAYGRSKLANLLFTYELQRRFAEVDAATIAVAAHPGISSTNLANHMLDNWYLKTAGPLMELMLQSAAMGALPTLRAAVDPNVEGGDYYGPDGYKSMRGYPVRIESNDASHDAAAAKKLWQLSADLTGVNFDPLDSSDNGHPAEDITVPAEPV